MIKKATLALMGALLTLAVIFAAPANAQPLSNSAVAAAVGAQVGTLAAGNGTNDFYKSGKCGINFPLGVWIELSSTNYDSGANQVYHTAIRRSGSGVAFKVQIDGVVKTTSTEAFITISGHGQHKLTLEAWILGGTHNYCSFYL